MIIGLFQFPWSRTSDILAHLERGAEEDRGGCGRPAGLGDFQSFNSVKRLWCLGQRWGLTYGMTPRAVTLTGEGQILSSTALPCPALTRDKLP